MFGIYKKKGIGKALILIGLFVSQLSFGQNKFPESSAEFIQQYTSHLKALRTADADSGSSISSVWDAGRLTTEQKKGIIGIVNTMYDKRLKIHSYDDFNDIIHYSINKHNISSPDLDTLIYATSKVIASYTSNEFDGYLETLAGLYKNGYLYKNKYNTLEAKKAKFRVRYIEQIEPVVDYTMMEEEEEETETEEPEYWEDFSEEEDAGWDDWGTSDDGWGEETEEETTTTETDGGSQMEDEGFSEAVLEIGYTPTPQPERDGAIIEFEQVNFVMKTAYDTAAIDDTKGFLLLKKNTFVGEGGKFDWTTAGLTSAEYVLFKEYNFDIRSPKLSAEGVTLHYPSKLEEPVEGVFDFKSSKRGVDGKASYPRFMSYKSNVVLKDLGDNIKYTGGFSLNGQQVYSNCVSEGKATLEIFYEGEKKLKAKARRFIFGDSVITAQPVSCTIYIKSDSITHPGLMLRYQMKDNFIKLYKNKTKFKNSPFVDSYHNMEIYTDAILWELSDTLLNLTNVTAKNYVPARFESELFYQKLRYTQIKGLFPFHPLQLVTYHSMKKRSRKLYFNDLLESNKQNRAVTANALKSGLTALMEQGYIDYNPRTGYIFLKDKAIHYVNSARGKKDFDNISIKSIAPPGHNSSLNLNNNELIVYGVDRVELSDSLSVYFEPRNRIVRIQENRDFVFDGIIYTANYIFNGHDFKFSYDKFLCDLQHIDSIRFKIDVKDTVTGRTKDSKTLNNKLVYTAGILYIDKPDNKSSRVRNARYPYFDADKGAYVYFDKKEVLNHAYDKSVYFFIPPFDQDSLSSNNSEAVGFSGNFVSGDIFPEFEEKLVVRPDFSFGFEHPVPKEGFQLYKGNGTFFGTITLDKKGLRGRGKIEFLNSVIESNDFVFYVDSVYAKNASVVTKKGTHPDVPSSVTFPEMHLSDAIMNWYPRKDSLYLETKKEPFTFYEETATLDGISTITTKGMYGKGILKTRGSRTFSDRFHFEENRYGGREALFEILTDNPAKPALRSENCKLVFELDSAKAYFSPEVQGFASNSFPYLKYKSSLDKGSWDLETKIIHMEKPEDAHISTSYFYSTHPKQDSLVFNAEGADYLMESQTLNISGVPQINVADAYIFPDSNFVQIRENAKMVTLEDAVIIVDSTFEYHRLYDGVIDIRSRNKFDGHALYEYINFGKDTFAIEFKSFLMEERPTKKKDEFEYHTMCKGTLTLADSFMIAPEVLYKGKVTMKADKRVLEFEGEIELALEGPLKIEHWLPYENLDGSPEFKVPVNEPKSKRGHPLFAGLHLKSTGGLYSTFLDTKKSTKDRTVFSADGVMMEDYETHSFKVAPYEKIKGKQNSGNMAAYYEEDTLIKYEGKFDLVVMAEGQEKNLESKFVGLATDSLADTTKFANLLSQLQFDMPGAAESKMGDKLKAYVEVNGGEKCNLMLPEFRIKIANVMGDEDAQKYEDAVALNYIALCDFSKDLSKGIVLSDLKMKWSEDYNAWYSVGQLGVSSVAGVDINTYMNGYVEIKHALNGDIVNVYIEPNEETWFFLSFKDNALYTISSDEDYNKVISSKSQMEKNMMKGLYFFAPASAFEKQKFINNFQGVYLGNENVNVILDPNEAMPSDTSDTEFNEDELEEDFEDGGTEEEFDEGDDTEEEVIDESEIEEDTNEIPDEEFYDPDRELQEELDEEFGDDEENEEDTEDGN